MSTASSKSVCSATTCGVFPHDIYKNDVITPHIFDEDQFRIMALIRTGKHLGATRVENTFEFFINFYEFTFISILYLYCVKKYSASNNGSKVAGSSND